MHIFLTGEIQVGKSTVVRKAAELSGLAVGGFLTYFHNRSSDNRTLHISEAGQDITVQECSVVAEFYPGGIRLHPERFDELGVQYIQRARERAKLIIMDECGRFEQTAHDFLREIIMTLDGGVPVLGVLKQRAAPWMDEIKNHSGVRVYTVTEDNRNALPEIIARELRGS